MANKFKAKKRFGQHLLVSEGVISKIVDVIDVKENDIIVEIGVGTGQLTKGILRKNPKILYGIEIDKTTYNIIEEKFNNFANFVLVKDDFFNVNLFNLVNNEKIKLVGNLPYNVSSLILINTVFYIDLIEKAVFMLQKEVAEKLMAKPNNKNFTFLSVFMQTFFEIEYVMSVPPRFFSPPPKVISAVVKLIPKKDFPNFDRKSYKNFVSSLFVNKRKMLKKKLPLEILEKAKISPTSRVEDLKLEDFINLFKIIKNTEKKI